ncbi:hypothetical protein [uncultured Citrobacter sp.]|uniref:hypothetical protein n=1 Tax=uncultured Citrobacter sp. TaxID=200446 RepID=UPI0025972113|nr:hypothetical protein [uncultured Citrobacter sp.]
MENNLNNDMRSDDHIESYKTNTTIEDLNKLLLMAEDASDKAKALSNEMIANKQKSYWILGGAYVFVNILVITVFFLDMAQYEYRRYLFVIFIGLGIVMAIPLLIMFANMRKKQMKLEEDIQIEYSVLTELLSLIHELDSFGRYVESIDSVSLATIRMRMKRLRFSLK